jgi:DNA-binding NarL/FixJ family response regulator
VIGVGGLEPRRDQGQVLGLVQRFVVIRIGTVAAGETYIGQRVAQKLALHATRRGSRVLSVLSENEFELLRLLATGHSLAEAAEVLDLTTKTVANYQAISR